MGIRTWYEWGDSISQKSERYKECGGNIGDVTASLSWHKVERKWAFISLSSHSVPICMPLCHLQAVEKGEDRRRASNRGGKKSCCNGVRGGNYRVQRMREKRSGTIH